MHLLACLQCDSQYIVIKVIYLMVYSLFNCYCYTCMIGIPCICLGYIISPYFNSFFVFHASLIRFGVREVPGGPLAYILILVPVKSRLSLPSDWIASEHSFLPLAIACIPSFSSISSSSMGRALYSPQFISSIIPRQTHSLSFLRPSTPSLFISCSFLFTAPL